jgi:hypothetical protein
LNSSPSSNSKPKVAQNDFRLSQFDVGRAGNSPGGKGSGPVNVSTLDSVNQLEMLLMSSPENRTRNNLYKPAFRNIDPEKPTYGSSFTASNIGPAPYGTIQGNSAFQGSGNYNGGNPQNFGHAQNTNNQSNQGSYQGSPYRDSNQGSNSINNGQNYGIISPGSPYNPPQRNLDHPHNSYIDPLSRPRSQDKSPYVAGVVGNYSYSPQRPDDRQNSQFDATQIGNNEHRSTSAFNVGGPYNDRSSSPATNRLDRAVVD